MSHARSIRLVVSFVSYFEMTESTELKKAAEADLHDAPQPPFPAPPPSQGNRPGNEVASTTDSALTAQEEDEDVRGTESRQEKKTGHQGQQVRV